MRKFLLFALFAFAITMNAQNRHERVLRHADGRRQSSFVKENNESALPRRMARKAEKSASDLLCDSIVCYDNEGKKFVITEYSYDKQGNLICRKDSLFNNGVSYYNYMQEYTYDEQGNKTSYSHYSRIYNGDWEPRSRNEYTYDAQGNLTSNIDCGWMFPPGWYYKHKIERIYDAQGRCTECQYSTYDMDAKEWNLYGKEQLSYNDQGYESGYNYYELSDDDTWEESETGAYKYDDKGNIKREYYYINAGLEWLQSCEYEYNYDEQGNLISFYYSDRNGPFEGVYVALKEEYTYDEHGNNITTIHYSGYDLEPSYKDEYTYDAQGNIASRQSYDYSNGEWKKGSLYIYHYSSHASAIEYKVNDTFEYQSGENTLFCRITETAEGGRGKVDIEGENDFYDGPTQNYFSAEKEPKGKLVVPAIVTDPNGDEYYVETIAKHTYYNCRQLKELDLNCKTLGDAAFAYCENVEKVTLGDNVTTFYPGPFFHSGIKSINLNKVTEIYCYDAQPFEGCTNLEEITVPEDNPAFVAVDNVLFSKDMKRLITFPYFVDYASWSGFPEGLEKIEPYAFIYLNTKKFVLPSSLGDIRFSYSSAFVNCTVDELYVNGKYVSTAAFNNSDIKAVHIGSDVEFIGQINFTGFYTNDIYLHGTSLPDWEYDSTSFYSSFRNCFDATLHVMPGFDLPAKIAADTNKWANFTNVVEDVEVPEEVSITDCTATSAASAIYNLQGQPVNANHRGIIISNGKKYIAR